MRPRSRSPCYSFFSQLRENQSRSSRQGMPVVLRVTKERMARPQRPTLFDLPDDVLRMIMRLAMIPSLHPLGTVVRPLLERASLPSGPVRLGCIVDSVRALDALMRASKRLLRLVDSDFWLFALRFPSSSLASSDATHLTQVKWTKHRRGIIQYRMKVLDIEDAEIAIKSRPFWAVPWKVVRACVLMSMLHFMLTLMRCVTVAG